MRQVELDTIKQAILNEIEGFEFYTMAADRAHSEETRQAFTNIANEEMKHVEWLRALFIRLKDNSDDAFNLAMLSDPPEPNLYDFSQLEGPALQTTVSVFGIGVQMEKAAIDFYTAAMEQATDAHSKALYKTLIAWEQGHLEQFSTEYDQLMHEYWSEQHFAPF